MSFKHIYSSWSPTNKIMFKLAIAGIIIGIIVGLIFWIISTFYGPDIYNASKGYVGLKVTPEEIIYPCNNTRFFKGITKTITVTNYDNQTREDITLEVDYPKDLSVSLNDLDKVNRGLIESMVFMINDSYLITYPITSLTSGQRAQFDVSLYAENCSQDLSVHFSVTNLTVDVGGRIYR